MLPCVPSNSIASITLSRLCAGSPMPMNTTLLTARRRRASTTCATISALPSWRSKPLRPLMQKTHPTAQPTCVETHSPPRGSSTLSTIWPSCSSTSSRATPFIGGILTVQARQSIQLRLDGGQLIAQRKRKESLCGAAFPVVRAHLAPAAQQTIFVARLGTEIAQTLAKVGDAQRGRRGGNQSGFGNDCGEVMRILTQGTAE